MLIHLLIGKAYSSGRMQWECLENFRNVAYHCVEFLPPSWVSVNRTVGNNTLGIHPFSLCYNRPGVLTSGNMFQAVDCVLILNNVL